MIDYKQMALDEYNSEITTAHHGYVAGGAFWVGRNYNRGNVKSRPFWNVHATQFTFNPCFEFASVPGCTRYLFTATDCNKKVHTFEADTPMSLLTPIWGDIPEGYVELKVEALEDDGTPWSLVGGRTFYRCAPYAGPDAYPPKARSYRECALMAYRYIYNTSVVQHWLKYGTPDPDYDLNVYPSKMISNVVKGMVAYASIDPDNAENAMTAAKNAADYLLSITVGGDSPLAGLPPTYYTGFRNNDDETENLSAGGMEDMMMMFYPADAGMAYLVLEKATGEARYLEGAQKIADYYRRTVQENGTWPLILSIATGESYSINECMPDSIITFMKMMHDRTGEEIWNKLKLDAHAYRVQQRVESFNWEGQFEDSPASAHYCNLSHLPADDMIYYIAENQTDDPEAIALAEDLMRFVEDQFVVWGKHAPRNRWYNRAGVSNDKTDWHSPAAMEQYNWYVPIDGSTAKAMMAFLKLYKVNGNPLLLAKACTLADSITRMQNSENGLIPSHWTTKTCKEDGGDFWINCLVVTANMMLTIAEETESA